MKTLAVLRKTAFFSRVRISPSPPKDADLFRRLFSFISAVKCAEMREICSVCHRFVVKHCVSRETKIYGISSFAYFLERYARMKTPRVNRKVNSKNWPERVFHRERGIFTMKIWNIAYNKTLCKRHKQSPTGKTRRAGFLGAILPWNFSG